MIRREFDEPAPLENTDMKYLLILTLAVVALLLLNELVFKHGGPDKLGSFGAKLRDLGARFHLTIGIVAVLIILYFVASFLFRVLGFQWDLGR
jgi:hypothetical protein